MSNENQQKICKACASMGFCDGAGIKCTDCNGNGNCIQGIAKAEADKTDVQGPVAFKGGMSAEEQSIELDAGFAAQNYCRAKWGAARGHADWRRYHDAFVAGYIEATQRPSTARDALTLAESTFRKYGDLHAAKPDPVKAAANYALADKMRDGIQDLQLDKHRAHHKAVQAIGDKSATQELLAAAKDVFNRWHSIDWKAWPTAGYMERLGQSIAKFESGDVKKPVKLGRDMVLDVMNRAGAGWNDEVPSYDGLMKIFTNFAELIVSIEREHGITTNNTNESEK